ATMGQFWFFGPNPLSPPHIFKCVTPPSQLPQRNCPIACPHCPSLLFLTACPKQRPSSSVSIFGPNHLLLPHVVECTTLPSPPSYSHPPQPLPINCHHFFQ